MKTWFITGGTPGGFGLTYAEAALHQGDQVVVTARRPAELQEWAARHGDRALVLELDVTDAEQVRAAVRTAEERFGGIDVLVNNAGRGWFGSVEGAQDEMIRRTFDLNLFGVVEVVRAVLPGMRARGNGWIVNMSSVAGLVSAPGFGYYAAAKFALEGLSETLRHEVEPFGVRVLVVEPGGFRTKAYAGFRSEPVDETVAAYLPLVESVKAAFVGLNGKQDGDPVRGVQAVISAMNAPVPPQRLVLGNSGYDVVVAMHENALTELRANEKLSRSADFDTGLSAVAVPKAVENFVEATNSHDVEALFAVFGDGAAVLDDGNTYRGETEIRAWIRTHLIEPKIVITPTSFENDRLIASNAGRFPGSPLTFAFTFATKDGLVTGLSIEPV
ncbi:SDR family NAD(P)-dependent oxidoreductase [Kribbella sandramycini]|uniref:NAD(P)-dependent dehydrogenase (Short-subunit alcohol dehydrogenase family) n=1 Tax=Kribbella sandramycini TaxID=60450 RepID=A0A7Y4L590_9ACTN|nr:oxidoreductase [Kribbella sandramycini]MBB6571166.1 NAD(P)-dependent dehydrogenase (short-subunit alcohol dehydrogenase family) [Kribbella sandramycini]NOL43426.1 SDR family NAD(P)-dependent oxidoreductase [Kribbella sandramycini]